MNKFISNNIFLFKKIREYSKSYLFVIMLVSLTAFSGPFTTVLIPKLIMDALLSNETIWGIVGLILISASANILRVVVKTIYNEVYVPYHQNKIQRGINVLLMEKSKKLDLKCYDNPDFYNKYTRALGQADSGLTTFIDNFATLIDRFFYIITVISIVFVLDSTLILFGLICVFTLFFFNKKSSQCRYTTSILTTKDARRADYSKRIHYLPEYAKETRSSDIGETLIDYYMEASKNQQSTVRKRSWKILGITLADEGIRIFVLQLLVMLYLVYRIQQGQLEVSSFIALFMATMQISYELFSFVNCLNGFYKLSLYTEDLMYILNYESDIEQTVDSIIESKKIQRVDSLVMSHVDFSYDGEKNVLKNININISKGEHIALVGYNGAGKTSLTKMLMRLYDPNRGEILLNGINLAHVDIHTYREMFGVVYQDYSLYALTLAENVLLKKVETKEEREKVIDALKKSQLYDDIASLPHGIDTILTKEFDEDGVVLSGGQAQKLALARVFVQNDRSIFILDEASSAMDPISEANVNQAILDFCKDKILILISHRLSISKDMDNIYVLDNGQIVESGSHAELMDQDGVYSEMYRVQSENYK